jgi:signal transduction histidine kinase/DNA-binding response OmpR family regulator
MSLQLRHRLIIVWLCTIVLAMSIAAGLFMVLLLDFHHANAQARLLDGFEHLQNRISGMASIIRENGKRFAARSDVVSSLSMIERYQDRITYRPLVFDPEKKHLAGELASLVQASGMSEGKLHSGSTAVAGFSGGRPGFLSYDGQGEPVFWRAESSGEPFTRQTAVDKYLQTPVPKPLSYSEVELRLSVKESVLTIEGIIPILRHLADGKKEIVGHLVLSQFLDQDFVDEISRHLGLELLLYGERMISIGEASLPQLPTGQISPELSRLTKTATHPLWLTSENYYAATARLPLAQGVGAHLVLGLNKVFLHAEIRALRLAMLVGLLIATLVILGVGLLYLRRVISHPLGHLLHGIEAVSSGNFVPLEGGEKDDELGRMAHAFNKMAAKLETQQQELLTLNQGLEQRVEERTAELEQARDSAEAANRAKSLFLSNMSHELRTPLNAILGFAQLMQHAHNLTQVQQHDLGTINNSGQHLLALINDVLEISRIESGRLSLTPNIFNLHTLLGAVEEMIRLRADRQGLSLRAELADDLPEFVEGDEHRLRQVLINLLGNAVKYTDSGWVDMRVRLDHSPPASSVRFEVEDTGLGIDESDRRRIFEPFFQAAGGIAKGEGTGLGLAISHEYVALMGGKITVESHPGEGSLFHFSIPLEGVDSATVTEAEGKRQVIGLQPGQLNFRILVAEDNSDSRQLLHRILEKIGLTVRDAVDGQQAVEQFEQWRPQFIWMDMRMPVMDGYEATRRIKAHPAGDKTVVVALTASAFEEDRAKVLAAGCDDFVRKPVTEATIYSVLERHLGLRFRYAGVEKPQALLENSVLLQRMDRLPDDLQTALRNGVLVLDPTVVEEAIDKIGTIDAKLAETLKSMLEGFRFNEILELLPEEQPADPDSNERQS